MHGWFRNFRNVKQSFENKKSLLAQPWQPRKSTKLHVLQLMHQFAKVQLIFSDI